MWPPAWTLSVCYPLSSVPKIIPLLSVRIGLTDAWPDPDDVRMSQMLIPEITGPVEEILLPVYVVGDGGLGWDVTLNLILASFLEFSLFFSSQLFFVTSSSHPMTADRPSWRSHPAFPSGSKREVSFGRVSLAWSFQ